PLPGGRISDEALGSAHSTGIRFGIEGYPPARRCLRGWWWGDPGIGDLSLYDDAGLTHARIVLDRDQWHLRTPVSWPRRPGPDLEEARHGAGAAALASLAFDPKLAARIEKDNTTPHPMGPPLNRQPLRTDGEMLLGAGFKIAETQTDSGIDTSIPDFL